MKKYPSYSIAIRTLGTAGDKYIKEIHSLYNQEVAADDIFIYIPKGYSVTPVHKEKYIVCEKGMVRQRSLPFTEIKSDYILFLDDDMFLPPDAVKKMFDALLDNNADCVAAQVYNFLDIRGFFVAAFFSGTYPSFSDKYAYTIRDDSHYSYCIKPKDVMPTQTASFACYLCKKTAYEKSNFQDELWLDNFSYALGDDQLFFYKLFKKGFKVLVHFNSGVVHLDAKSGGIKNAQLRDCSRRTIRFILWYRTIYKCKHSIWGRLLAIALFSIDFLRSCLESIFRMLLGEFYAFPNSIKALYNAIKYVKSKEYKSFPPFL